MTQITRNSAVERLAALNLLDQLDDDGNASPDHRVLKNLERWHDGGPKPDTIYIRPGFVHRVHPLTSTETAGVRIEDRISPNLGSAPPLARLVGLPKGVALRMALTLLFIAQTRPSIVGPHGKLKIGTMRSAAGELDVIDLVASTARHRGHNADIASSAEANRERQVVSALERLSKPDVRLVALGSGPPKERYANIRLRDENYDDAGPSGPYTVPAANAPGLIAIPTAFFLRGWVHTLSNREIAMWLMLRDLDALGMKSTDPNDFPLRISGRTRLTQYDLKATVYETNRALNDYGLIDVKVDPDRRSNGTTLNGERAEPNAYKLTDEGLNHHALTVVRDHWRSVTGSS